MTTTPTSQKKGNSIRTPARLRNKMSPLEQKASFPGKAQPRAQSNSQPAARVQSWESPTSSRKPHEPFVSSLLNPAAPWSGHLRQPSRDPDLARRQRKKRTPTQDLAREAIVRSAGKAWSERLCTCTCEGLQPPQALPESWEFGKESGGICRVGGDKGGLALSKLKSPRRETPARCKLGVPQSYTRPLRCSKRNSTSASGRTDSDEAIVAEKGGSGSWKRCPSVEEERNIPAPGLGHSFNGDGVESSNRVQRAVRRSLPGDALFPEERYHRDPAARKTKSYGMSTHKTASAPSQTKMSAEELQAFILATLTRLHREAKEKHK
jgi:hypothetical protein